MSAAIETQEVVEKKQKREKMEPVTFHLPKPLLNLIDDLVRRGIYPNRSEAIRDAIRLLLAHFIDHETQPQ